MRKFIPIIILAFLLLPSIAQAQQSCYEVTDHPCYPFGCPAGSSYLDSAGNSIPCHENNPRETLGKLCCLIDDIANILFVLGLGLAIIALIVGGIAYVTSGGDQARTDRAKKIITYGLIGAAIILLAGFVVNLLDEVIIQSLVT